MIAWCPYKGMFVVPFERWVIDGGAFATFIPDMELIRGTLNLENYGRFSENQYESSPIEYYFGISD